MSETDKTEKIERRREDFFESECPCAGRLPAEPRGAAEADAHGDALFPF